MDEDAFNLSVKRFLKKLGVTSKREIELAVREQIEATVTAICFAARRALLLEAEAADLETQIEQLVRDIAGWLLDEPGVGPITTD